MSGLNQQFSDFCSQAPSGTLLKIRVVSDKLLCGLYIFIVFTVLEFKTEKD